MGDARAVRRVQRARDLDRNRERLCERERTLVYAVRQRVFEVGHDQERRTELFAHVIQRADVRMIERRDRARLAIEALTELRISREALWKDLMATVRSRRVSRAV
jgi:hypothetical protein